MSNLEFYQGSREVDRFNLKIYGNKTILSCRIEELWEERLSRSISCGRSRTFTFKKTLGVTLTEREELEATISSSLGLDGISELKSEIKSKIGRELQLEESQETQEEFSFQAPKCGRTTFQVYQIRRLHHFSYQDRRPWIKRWWYSSKDFNLTTTERINRIYDLSTTIDRDPECFAFYPECKGAADKDKKPEGFINLIFETFGLLAGYRHDERGIVLTDQNVSVPVKNINELLYSNITFDSKMLPPYLLFLADVRTAKLTAQVFPYRGELAKIQRGKIRDRGIFQKRGQTREAIPVDLTSILIGGAIGAALTLLLSTKSGQELGKNIIGAARQFFTSPRKEVLQDRTTIEASESAQQGKSSVAGGGVATSAEGGSLAERSF
jgi:hypothetical protein